MSQKAVVSTSIVFRELAVTLSRLIYTMVSRVISTPFYREIEGGKEHDKAKYTI
jgi:hypothetical protein